MADKRYQVFISSTFSDLEEERLAVAAAIMSIGHIPAGMEHFPALDQDQLAFIHRVIDQSDYYVVVIGNRYGSMTEEGVSYTEEEYRYARSKGLKVMAFLKGNPGETGFDKSDTDSKARKKLAAFRTELQKNRLTKNWDNKDDLAQKVTAAILYAINLHPGIGWIRASEASDVDVLKDLNVLRKKNEELQAKLQTEAPVGVAGTDEEFTAHATSGSGLPAERTETWGTILGAVVSAIEIGPMEYAIKRALSQWVVNNPFDEGRDVLEDPDAIKDEDFRVIKATLLAHGFIEIGRESRYWTWSLTPKGLATFVASYAARTQRD